MIPNIYPGKFICVEGLDGSGKDTQGALLYDLLCSSGLKTSITSEPTDGLTGRKIKQILKKEIPAPDPHEFQRMFSEDRVWHNKKFIAPHLRRGVNVITLRYEVSTKCYGLAFGVPGQFIDKWNGCVLEPDLTLIIQVRAETCIHRLSKRGEKEYFEKLAYLKKVAIHYSSYGNGKDNVLLVDGEGSREETFSEVRKLVSNYFNWRLV